MEKLPVKIEKTNFFYFSLLVFVTCLPLSEFMVSVSAGIMFLITIIEDNLQNKISRLKEHKVILFLPALFLVYLLSFLITRNGETATYDLKKALFFIILPIAFLLGKEISSRQKQIVFFVFIASVIIASIYAVMNWRLGHSEDLNIHNASLITHIRFSFQLILAIWFLVFFGFKTLHFTNLQTKFFVFVSALGLLGFMFLQQSLTGIVSFVISIVFILFYLIFSVKGLLRYILLTLILTILVAPVIYIAEIAYPFYHPKKYGEKELVQKTKLGNSYQHDVKDRLIENGNFVFLFVCEPEMKEEWNKVSTIKYDSLDRYGYEVKSTLVRYLTSKGLKKDAEGVKALTSEDIKSVENGVSNYLFKEKRWSLFPRIYVTIWEFYGYTKLNLVNNQSLSQRLEFSKAALSIIKENFWIGVGTGNWKKAFYDTYKKMNSNLSENYYASSHNQYLNYLVKFGIIGFMLIMFFIIYPVVKTKRFRDPLFLVFLVFMFVANFADSNFESHMGSSFFVFFYCFFLITDGIEYFVLPNRKKG